MRVTAFVGMVWSGELYEWSDKHTVRARVSE